MIARIINALWWRPLHWLCCCDHRGIVYCSWCGWGYGRHTNAKEGSP